jgi:hypothetical protein
MAKAEAPISLPRKGRVKNSKRKGNEMRKRALTSVRKCPAGL